VRAVSYAASPPWALGALPPVALAGAFPPHAATASTRPGSREQTDRIIMDLMDLMDLRVDSPVRPA